MNITTAFPNYPVNPVPSGDIARRESQQKELISQPTATESSARERATDSQANTYARPMQRQNSVGTNGSENRSESENPTLISDDESAISSDEIADDAVIEEREESSDEDDTSERQEDRDEAQEEEKIEELSARDQEVRTHEQQHAAVGGQYASAPSYSFERGPDGKSYAVDGNVSIDISAVPNDPEATIQKMSVVRRAALAPAEPSASDRAAAAEASQKAAEARTEIATQDTEQGNSLSASTEGESENADRQQRIGQFYQSAVSPRESAALELTA